MHKHEKLFHKGHYEILDNLKKERPLSFLTVGGSLAYGTNIEGSDLDLRGIVHQLPSEILGLEEWDVLVANDKELDLDISIGGYRHMFKKLMKCNPNSLEIAGVEQDDIIFQDDAYKLLRENIDVFYSKFFITKAFSGYAQQQLKNLENALAHDSYPEKEKQKHILQSLKRAINALDTKVKQDMGDLNIYIDDESGILKVSGNLDNIPLQSLHQMNQETSNIIRTYNKLNKRNRKKTDKQLNKHAMHLVRLMMMQYYLCLNGELRVKHKGEDLSLLMDIRQEKFFDKEQRIMKPEFYEIVEYWNNKSSLVSENCKLFPEQPNMLGINDLFMKINEISLSLQNDK